MSVPEIHYCPGTLAAGYHTYSPTCLNRVFSGRKVDHILQYNAPEVSEEDAEKFMQNRKRLSISGVQEKVSLVLDKNRLRLAEEGDKAAYILKPIPRDVRRTDQVPANEHLTMQIARQVYGIEIAENALIFFKNGDPAYLTKRFDVKEDGSKRGKEDFATLAGRTSETHGADFKYNYSYEEAAALIKRFVPAYPVELEKFFSLVLFNYLYGNGDAHLKNFSLIESPQGDYMLSPAYDLMNTRLHVDGSAMALRDGLFKDFEMTPSFEANGFYAFDDFYEFGNRIGLISARMERILRTFMTDHEKVQELVSHSFLREDMKKAYLEIYQEKLKTINYSYSGKRI